MNRRAFLASGLASLAGGHFSLQSDPDFSFVHFTDVHIQDELQAARFSRRCFEQISRHNPSFSICGGDLVFDVNAVSQERARHLFDLYLETERFLEMPVHHAIGNHDVCGTSPENKAFTQDKMYGKGMFEARIGRTYYSFDFRHWHFIVLDSVSLTAEGSYSGLVEEDQLEWLESDLRRSGKETPTVITTHIPLVTGFLQYGDLTSSLPANQLVIQNSRSICDLISKYSIKAVLQGHTHICELLVYQECQYLTTGAVCGNWWKGPRLGFPEGYNLLQVEGDQINARYIPYDKG
jgi:3',5'-cyclic-AMP phosphodiesterase